jgi:hypothetical protein
MHRRSFWCQQLVQAKRQRDERCDEVNPDQRRDVGKHGFDPEAEDAAVLAVGGG